MEKQDPAEPELGRSLLEGGNSLQEYLSSVDFPPARQDNSQVEEDLFWDCFERSQGSSREAGVADQQSEGAWAAESTPSVSQETPGEQPSSTSSGADDVLEYFPALAELSEPKVQELLKEMSFESLFLDLSPSDFLEREAKGDREANLEAQRIELEKDDSREPKLQRSSPEGGRETHPTEDGSPGNPRMSSSPQKAKRQNEDVQPSWRISLQESLDSGEVPHAQHSNTQMAEDCFEGFRPGGQWEAKSIPDVNEEAPVAQGSSPSPGTENTAEHFPVMAEQSEPKVPEMLEGGPLDSLFVGLSVSDPLKTEVKAKDGKDGLTAQRTEFDNHRSAGPKPRRRSLEVEGEIHLPEVGSPGKRKMSPSPEKMKRPNEDEEPFWETSHQESLNTARSPQAEHSNTQVAKDCIEGFQPGGQLAAETLPGVSGEASGSQKSNTASASATEDTVEYFTIFVEPSEIKVPVVLEKIPLNLSPSGSLKTVVKTRGDTRASLTAQRTEMENHDSAESQQLPGRGLLEGVAIVGEKVIVQSGNSEKSGPIGSPVVGQQMASLGAEIQKESLQGLERCGQLDPARREADQILGEETFCLRRTPDTEYSEKLVPNSGVLKSVPVQRKKKLAIYSGINASILRHKQIQKGEEPYKCSHCGKCFNTKSKLSKHERIHTGEKPYKCSHCGKCCSAKSELSKHERTHTGEKPYACLECGNSFRTHTHLSIHVRSHTGEKPYQCSCCGMCFTTRSNLSRHKQSHTGEKPFQCSHCGKCLSSNASLLKHERTHTGEKPYQCLCCGKCFISSSNLSRHERFHTGKKPYQCSHCGKCFTSSSGLTEHEQTHTGEKPYICSCCGERFITSSKLSRHEQSHAGAKHA